MMRAVVILAALLAPSLARADDKMRAVALFDEGIKEMKAGNHAKACPLLAESNRLFADSGTRGTLARCYTQLGKVASAWLLWRELADTAPAPDLRADAGANATKLEPRLPRYVIVMAAGGPKDVAVFIDGQAVSRTLDVPTPIDPGTYRIEVQAAGYATWKSTFTAVEGKTVRIDVPFVVPPKHDDVVTPPVVDPPPAEDRAERRRSRRRLGIAITGGGVIALAAGGVFGSIASSTYSSAKDICGGSIERCAPERLAEAQDEVDRARSTANVSTILFVAGGAIAVTGIVLIVTAPSAEQAQVSITPSIDASGAGFVVSGSF